MIYSHEIQIRVRYGETDQMGMLYYGNYCQYYEVGRVEALRSLGLTYKELEEVHRILMPVVSMEVRYLRPAKYDDELRIVTSISQIRERHVVFHTEIFGPNNKILNQARIKLCFVNAKSGRTIETPGLIKHLIETQSR